MNKKEEGIKNFLTAVDLNPCDSIAYNNLGNAHRDANKK